MSYLEAHRGLVAAVVAVSAIVTAAHADAAQAISIPAAAGCQSEWRGWHLWSTLQPDLHPSAGSAAAFRLAEERSQILSRVVSTNLQPTPRSPAAFRLADQHSLAAAAAACLSQTAAGQR